MRVDGNALTNDPRARARFVEARKKAKKFIVQKRGYKLPDFNRMILDLRNLGWSHEKIAYVLDVQGGSTVSAWATGSVPDYVHGEQFVMLWREQTGIQREPREGEWQTYKYDIGQLDLLDVLDNFADQLDEELAV
ncbi:MAG: hypothetical protein A2003_13260 [Acinetobacter sp. GWC1_38_13]|uniref:hypothetical protein n=1 Tax=Acinetobacter sp. GWC1_38_13 TaxID=1797234 RepID=UPI0008D81B2C|nr:hypothetical protein [Acinetobacter sp. GWC1_38_13]OFW44122.1 MAG: hypothetical protein A2003_13260 [Acinetobacter sp. GWC1_38_13]HAV56914.1 hypothetical protein [Acinetobacter junii]